MTEEGPAVTTLQLGVGGRQMADGSPVRGATGRPGQQPAAPDERHHAVDGLLVAHRSHAPASATLPRPNPPLTSMAYG
ncbi:hypothetical protein [Streptomyces bikiniensis]|uniref:hypothetical protein n=1 Tax=Streptomyces bikiniensis TaxID=1896 RepID=UPI000B2CE798